MLEDWTLRLRSLFRRRTVERDLEDEMRFHIERQAAAYTRAGLSHEEAVRRARLEFGTFDQVREEHRDARGIGLIEDVARDLRYAMRQIRRAPGFSATVILCLALGIGATTTVYSVVNAILIRPLPFPESDRLVRIVEYARSDARDQPVLPVAIPYQDFINWRGQARTLSDLFAVLRIERRLVETPRGAARLRAGKVSPNAFAALRIDAMLGRTLIASDNGNPSVAVLSFEAWQQHFNSDTHVAGTTLVVRDAQEPRVLTVVGVLPAAFSFPTQTADFYVPADDLNSPDAAAVTTMIGRLADGASLEAATDELNTMAAATRPQWADDAAMATRPRIELRRLKDVLVGDMKPALRIFLTAVMVVLLIVCANVANLLLARGTVRAREMAVRLAIGASRGRIVRQVMTESFVLSMAGGALGALIGAGGVSMVKRLATIDAPGVFARLFGTTVLPRAHEVTVDSTILASAFIVSAIASLLFGMVPALHLSRTRQSWTVASLGHGLSPIASWTRSTLVVAQIGLATVLLIVAGLLAHSFMRLSDNDKGYDPTNVLALQLFVPNDYSVSRKAETIDRLLARFRASPGVIEAGFARHGIFLPQNLTIGSFVPYGGEHATDNQALPSVRAVSEGFLIATGIAVIEGRDFTARDDGSGAAAVVLNRSAARQFFGSSSSVGKLIDWRFDKLPVQLTVIGVVTDVRQESLSQDTFPEVYLHYRQLLRIMARNSQLAPMQDELAIGLLSFAIRTHREPEASTATIREAVRLTDPNIAVDALGPMDSLVTASVARERFAAVMLTMFAAMGAALAAMGVYGVLSYLVAQRTREIGVRMALGATRSAVLAGIVWNGFVLTSLGIVLGLASAAATTRLIEGMLFGITSLDPLTFVAVAVMFGVVATLASCVPARRATMVDPMIALRSE